MNVTVLDHTLSQSDSRGVEDVLVCALTTLAQDNYQINETDS